MFSIFIIYFKRRKMIYLASDYVILERKIITHDGPATAPGLLEWCKGISRWSISWLIYECYVLILTILEFIRVSSSIASSCFLFSGSSVSSFLYFLLLLKNGAKREREKVLGAIFFVINVTQFLCCSSVYIFLLEIIFSEEIVCT